MALPDFEKLGANAARFLEQSGKALQAYLKPFESGGAKRNESTDTMIAAVGAIGKVAEHWMSDPARMAEAQAAIATPFLQLWAQTYRRMQGETVAPLVPLAKGDKRFSAPEWSSLPLFEFLRQAHALGAKLGRRAGRWRVGRRCCDPRQGALLLAPDLECDLAGQLPGHQPGADALDVREFGREPRARRGAARGRHGAWRRDAAPAPDRCDRLRGRAERRRLAGQGRVPQRSVRADPIRTDDPGGAAAPAADRAAWINKFYILDLNKEKSFVAWAVAQGVTVFLVSWVNPDASLRDKRFEDYMHEGLFAALDAVRKATGERDANVIGYCIGGTLLAASLAYMAERNDKRVKSATFFTAQADFSDAGELTVFIDEAQLTALDRQMEETGYLDGAKMANVFNMLRPTDLLWSYVVDNYMKGKQPAAFDLLYWNSDSTRVPARNHSFYLRNFYLENRLAKGTMEFSGVGLDLGRIDLPTYFLAAKEDHIAPAASVFRGALLFGGTVRYVLAGSGHIAGVINPPAKQKYWYMTGGRPFGTLEDWSAQAIRHPGSWWTDWAKLAARAGIGDGAGARAGSREAAGALRCAWRLCAGEELTG